MWSRADPRRHKTRLCLNSSIVKHNRCCGARPQKLERASPLVVRFEFFNLPKGLIFSICRTR
jgi:hypothetical protein